MNKSHKLLRTRLKRCWRSCVAACVCELWFKRSCYSCVVFGQYWDPSSCSFSISATILYFQIVRYQPVYVLTVSTYYSIPSLQSFVLNADVRILVHSLWAIEARGQAGFVQIQSIVPFSNTHLHRILRFQIFRNVNYCLHHPSIRSLHVTEMIQFNLVHIHPWDTAKDGNFGIILWSINLW